MHHICNQVTWWTWLAHAVWQTQRGTSVTFLQSSKWSVVTLPFLSVIYLSLRDKHAALITQVSSPSLHELMSTNIRSFHVHFSTGTLCLLKSVSSTRCLQASQLIWSTKADVRHATKLSNFVTQLCCVTKLPVWLRKLPNFWWVAQLICRIETISILGNFSLCRWAVIGQLFVYMWIVDIAVNC